MWGVKKESAWKFETLSTAGVGIEFVAAQGGAIYLSDPKGSSQKFRYGAAGVGLTFGLKLPKVGKLNLPTVKGKSVGGVVAPAAFPNMGQVFVADTFSGEELSRSDITGVCLFLEVGGGLIAGGSAIGMIFGMDPAWLGVVVASAEFLPIMALAETKLLRSATGILVTTGVNVGYQAGGGGAAFIGGIF